MSVSYSLNVQKSDKFRSACFEEAESLVGGMKSLPGVYKKSRERLLNFPRDFFGLS